ncbi:hypothetical protein BGZ50_005475 [Haplosporangium sp. Z 11]|nr:hypothetical protein BGZ50_005475 [Haplosporangium sp. Z 11]
MDKIPEHHTQNFITKSAFKPGEWGRGRNATNVEFRKQKHEEVLSKTSMGSFPACFKESYFGAITRFRKLLFNNRNPPIDDVIRSGVDSKFVEFLRSTHAVVQTQYVIETGAVPLLVELLSSPTGGVKKQAVWALGNIAGGSFRCRDIVLRENVLIPLLTLLHEDNEISMLRDAT